MSVADVIGPGSDGAFNGVVNNFTVNGVLTVNGGGEVIQESLTLTGNLSVGGTSTLTGNLSVGGTSTLTGNVSLSNNLAVAGTTTLTSANATGNLKTTADLGGAALLLTGTTNQVEFSSTNFFPTTVSVPTAAQTTHLTVPDPGVASSSFLLADSASAQSVNSGGLTLASTAPLSLTGFGQGFGLMTGASGAVVQAYPTIPAFQLAETVTTQYNTTVASGGTGTAVYTVPSGYYATTQSLTFNHTGGSSSVPTIYASPNAGTTLYQVFIGATQTFNTPLSVANQNMPYLPGDSVIFNPGTVPTGCTISASFTAWPVGSAGFVPIVIRNPVIGTSTMYTCPTGKRSSMITGAGMGQYGSSLIHASTTAGGTAGVFTISVVLANSNTAVIGVMTTIAGSATITNVISDIQLQPGDAIVMSCSANTALTQLWFTMFELPSANFN